MKFSNIRIKMTSKVVRPAMSLKQFMVRQKVLKLYRDIHRAIRLVPQEDSRNDLREWARTDFKKNKHQTDEYTIKILIFNAERSLKELQQSLAFSG